MAFSLTTSSEAVYVRTRQTAEGPDAIKPFFQDSLRICKAWRVVSMQQRYVESDYAYILWSAETQTIRTKPLPTRSWCGTGRCGGSAFAAKITPKR